MAGQFSEPYSATVNASGVAEISVRPPRLQSWTVSQVSTEMPDAPVGSACELRKNGSLVSPMVSTGDIASGDPPVQLLATDVLTIRWSSVTPGDVGKALVFYTTED